MLFGLSNKAECILGLLVQLERHLILLLSHSGGYGDSQGRPSSQCTLATSLRDRSGCGSTLARSCAQAAQIITIHGPGPSSAPRGCALPT